MSSARRAPAARTPRPARVPAVAPEPPPLAAVRRVALPLLVLLAAAFAWRWESSLDLGFHVVSGRWILDHHAWPRTDPFTYTLSDRPYVDMHGAFQVVAAWAYGAGGDLAIAILRTLAIVGALLMMWPRVRVSDGTGACAALLVLVPCLVAWEIRFLARPELVTYLALAAMLLLLERHRATADRRWLWACVPVQLAWVYGHALSLFGIFVLGAYAVATTWEARDRHAAPARLGRARDAWWVLGAAALATFLNPYGVEGVRFLWALRSRLQEGNPFGASIGELASPFSSVTQGFLPLVVLRGVLIGGAAIALARLRRLSPFEWLMVAGFGWLAATRIRNVGLFVVVVAPWLARELAAAWPRGATARHATLGVATAVAVAVAALAVTIASGSYYARDQRPVRFGYAASDGSYPTRVTARLASGEVRGPLFNALDHGGYLLARLWPRERVFLDGRLEVAGEAFYRDYLRVLSGEGWPAMTARYRPQAAVVPYSASALIQRLARDSTWRMIDADGAAALFVAVAGANTGARDAFAARAAAADTAALAPWRRPNPMASAFGRRRFPFVPWGRGNALLLAGRFDEARVAYAEALRAADADEPEIVVNYAGVCEVLGRRDEATAWYRRLLEISRGDARAHAGLARLGQADSR